MKRLLDNVSKAQEVAHHIDKCRDEEIISEETQRLVDEIVYKIGFADSTHISMFSMDDDYEVKSRRRALKHVIDYYQHDAKVVALYKQEYWFSIGCYAYSDVPIDVKSYPSHNDAEPDLFAFVMYSNACKEFYHSSGKVAVSYIKELVRIQHKKEMADSDALLKLAMRQIYERRDNELIIFTLPEEYRIDAKSKVLRQIIETFSDRADVVSVKWCSDSSLYKYTDVTDYFSKFNAEFRDKIRFSFEGICAFALHFRIRNVLERSRGPIPRI